MKSLSCLIAGAGILSVCAALAQPTQVPATADPGRLRERLDAPATAPSEASLPEPKGAAQDVLPEAVRALRVTLRAIRVEGSTVYSDAQWQVYTGPYLGREISGADIFALAQALTVRYRNDGYFLSVVIVPPQSLVAGIPGKVRRELTDEEVAGLLGNSARYVPRSKVYKAAEGQDAAG